MSDLSFLDFVGDADEAGQLARANFGKLSITPRYIHWQNKSPVEVTPAEYAQLSNKDRSLELTFEVNVQEFNPDLQFNVTRKLQVGGADWNKTLKPSLEAVFGAGATAKASLSKTLGRLVGAYVEVHLVDQQPRKDGKHLDKEGKPYSTLKLAHVFASRDEAYAAYTARFGKPDGAALPATPVGFDLETWAIVQAEIAQMLAANKTPAEVAAAYGVPLAYVMPAA